MYENDNRIVMTLDAGGTNMVFSAMKGAELITDQIRLDAVNDNLERCIGTIKRGFDLVRGALKEAPSAISFAFPGPADYKNGVIGDIPNFPAFKGGVPLGVILEDIYHIPVFIENDGNLFSYGEATMGMLPKINTALKSSGVNKCFKNLIGITFGTGFGAGVTIDGRLLTGDNGCGGDLWLTKNSIYPDLIAEESVSKRGVIRAYCEKSKSNDSALSPKDVFDIAEGLREGNRAAAISAFDELGRVAGASIASALDIADGLVVIGGGIAGASQYILPGLCDVLRSNLNMYGNQCVPMVEMEVFNWEDPVERKRFLDWPDKFVQSPVSKRKVLYHSSRRTAVAISENGSSVSIMKGAYAFALANIDNTQKFL
jgi:glucokinase